MFDKIETLGNSLIQHGKNNNRIYLPKLSKSDLPQITGLLDKLASKNLYSKIFVKVPREAISSFTQNGYSEEAAIPKFYNGERDGIFLAKFCDPVRAIVDPEIKSKIRNIIKIAREKQTAGTPVFNKPEFMTRIIEPDNIPALADLYKKVFKSYPFPIFEEKYLRKTMADNIIYFGAFKDDKLVAASSAELDISANNCEMTDFATLPEFRGNSLAQILLKEMEAEMRRRKVFTLYTIARAISAGMNITFAKLGYQYSGTLINNTNISGKIESMNIWYKHPLV